MGQLIEAPNGMPQANAVLDVMNAMGVQRASFGDIVDVLGQGPEIIQDRLGRLEIADVERSEREFPRPGRRDEFPAERSRH